MYEPACSTSEEQQFLPGNCALLPRLPISNIKDQHAADRKEEEDVSIGIGKLEDAEREIATKEKITTSQQAERAVRESQHTDKRGDTDPEGQAQERDLDDFDQRHG
jgi:hypothetical protein